MLFIRISIVVNRHGAIVVGGGVVVVIGVILLVVATTSRRTSCIGSCNQLSQIRLDFRQKLMKLQFFQCINNILGSFELT